MLSGSRGIDVSPSRCLALSLSRSTHVSPRPVSPQPRLSLSRRFSLGFALSALALSLKSRFSLGILSHSDFWLSTAVPFLPGQNSTFKCSVIVLVRRIGGNYELDRVRELLQEEQYSNFMDRSPGK